MPSKLYERTRQLMLETPIKDVDLAKAVGCSIKTLYLIRGNKNVPGVELCEAIYNYLSPTPLEVK